MDFSSVSDLLEDELLAEIIPRLLSTLVFAGSMGSFDMGWEPQWP